MKNILVLFMGLLLTFGTTINNAHAEGGMEDEINEILVLGKRSGSGGGSASVYVEYSGATDYFGGGGGGGSVTVGALSSEAERLIRDLASDPATRGQAIEALTEIALTVKEGWEFLVVVRLALDLNFINYPRELSYSERRDLYTQIKYMRTTSKGHPWVRSLACENGAQACGDVFAMKCSYAQDICIF
ncbi:MAG: hypothetical protein R2827_16215 [Bdellovibrionales bacterium]